LPKGVKTDRRKGLLSKTVAHRSDVFRTCGFLMRLLFVHQNFPGQWLHLAHHYNAIGGHEVVALRNAVNKKLRDIVRTVDYVFEPRATGSIYPIGDHFAERTGRAFAVAEKARELKSQGFVPDIIAGHAGWGETLFLKEIFPSARMVTYAEFFYRSHGADTHFDPEFPIGDERVLYGVYARNAAMITALAYSEVGLAPTRWQQSVFPEHMQRQIEVIHDGVDTRIVRPNPQASITLGKQNVTLRPGDEVVTFVNRNLEPYRGYHIFMRALPKIMAERPNARIVIVGGNGVSYGRPPPQGQSWRAIFLDEVKDRIDHERIHFVGNIAYPLFVNLLQVSAAHVYLTYPFVLSWSMLEAMAAGCALVASKTAPVEEMVRHGENGLLVDFFDSEALAETVVAVLAKPDDYREMRAAARDTIVSHYDLQTVCLPRQKALFERLAQA
jgi:glycosyltransferase involved in cell wall biosynthesis